jgi:hypothetical protein
MFFLSTVAYFHLGDWLSVGGVVGFWLVVGGFVWQSHMFHSHRFWLGGSMGCALMKSYDNKKYVSEK